MGAAAYNRGSRVIRRRADDAARPVEFDVMDRLNAPPKRPGAPRPFGPVRFVPGHGGWWAECPVTGFGYWYRSLVTAVRSWRVTVTSYDATRQEWGAEPAALSID